MQSGGAANGEGEMKNQEWMFITVWRAQLEHIHFIKANILHIHVYSFLRIATAVDQWFLDYFLTVLIVLIH